MRTFWKYLTRVHRYAGLILGVQVLIWFASGFFMSFFDIETVRGEHIAKKPATIAMTVDADVLQGFGQPIKSLKVIEMHAGPTVILAGETGLKRYDLTTQAWLSQPDLSEITQMAQKYYLPGGKPNSVNLLTKAPNEYRSVLPVWQVQFDDSAKTRLYLNADTGELVNVRTRLWRVFDFMWMLHIMDYDERDDINNWWLWLAALMASLFAISGIALVIQRIFLRPRRRR